MDSSELNSRAAIVLVAAVVTAIVLLAVVPKDGPYGGVKYGVVVASQDTVPPSTSLPSGSTAPGATTTTGATSTTKAATSTTKASTATTCRSGSTNTTVAPTTTTFPVAGRPTLKLGSTGPDVVALQQRLAALLGYNPGTADGSFGTGTQTQVQNFQKAKSLPPDGVVGPTTWAALSTG